MLAEQIFTPFGITEYNGYIVATDIPVVVDIAGRECHRQDDETNEENKRDPPERPAFRTNPPFIIYIFQVARFFEHDRISLHVSRVTCSRVPLTLSLSRLPGRDF
jgi:hypothetical protein